MLQSSHDEWAVIGTENCSPVACGVRPRDFICPKWNQSAAHVQFFLPCPHVVKTLSHLYTEARSQHALSKSTIPSKSKLTRELLGKNYKNMAIRPPLRSRGSAADKPSTRSSTLGPLGPAYGQLCLIVQFIKREEGEGEGEWRGRAVGLCTQLVLLRLCELVSVRRWTRREEDARNTTLLSLLTPHQCTVDQSKPKRAGFTGFEGPRCN